MRYAMLPLFLWTCLSLLSYRQLLSLNITTGEPSPSAHKSYDKKLLNMHKILLPVIEWVSIIYLGSFIHHYSENESKSEALSSFPIHQSSTARNAICEFAKLFTYIGYMRSPWISFIIHCWRKQTKIKSIIVNQRKLMMVLSRGWASSGYIIEFNESERFPRIRKTNLQVKIIIKISCFSCEYLWR